MKKFIVSLWVSYVLGLLTGCGGDAALLQQTSSLSDRVVVLTALLGAAGIGTVVLGCSTAVALWNLKKGGSRDV